MPYAFNHSKFKSPFCYSYTMFCPPVRGDNSRALASGLSYVQVDKIVYTYITIDLAHHKVFRAKVGNGGIKMFIHPKKCIRLCLYTYNHFYINVCFVQYTPILH